MTPLLPELCFIVSSLQNPQVCHNDWHFEHLVNSLSLNYFTVQVITVTTCYINNFKDLYMHGHTHTLLRSELVNKLFNYPNFESHRGWFFRKVTMLSAWLGDPSVRHFLESSWKPYPGLIQVLWVKLGRHKTSLYPSTNKQTESI